MITNIPQTKQEFAKHAQYQAMCKIWKKCRDCTAGQDAVKASELSVEYLPQPSGLQGKDYDRYKHAAPWYGATGRTVQGLTGVLTRKLPKTTYPDAAMLKSIGVADEPLDDLIQRMVRELLIVGRVGHLVDIAADGDVTKPLPYVAEYRAESILNWRMDRVGGRLRLVWVVLEECVTEVLDYLGATRSVRQFRVLNLGRGPANGLSASDVAEPFYWQDIYRYDMDGEGREGAALLLVKRIVPRKLGGRLWREIPFIFSNITTDGPGVEEPPLLDMVNVNISHYMTAADLEWGRHWTALPTPYVTGADETTTHLSIGSTKAWVITDAQAKVGMLEFSGAGLGHLAQGLKDKQEQLAVLGSRLLEARHAGVESAESIQLKQNSEHATLQGIAQRGSVNWTHILRWVNAWTNVSEPSDEISVEISSDFNLTKMDPTMMASMMAALQSGLISFDVWYYNLLRGEVLPPDLTLEQFQAQIQNGLPLGIDVVENSSRPEGDSEDEEDEGKGGDDKGASGAGKDTDDS